MLQRSAQTRHLHGGDIGDQRLQFVAVKRNGCNGRRPVDRKGTGHPRDPGKCRMWRRDVESRKPLLPVRQNAQQTERQQTEREGRANTLSARGRIRHMTARAFRAGDLVPLPSFATVETSSCTSSPREPKSGLPSGMKLATVCRPTSDVIQSARRPVPGWPGLRMSIFHIHPISLNRARPLLPSARSAASTVATNSTRSGFSAKRVAE